MIVVIVVIVVVIVIVRKRGVDGVNSRELLFKGVLIDGTNGAQLREELEVALVIVRCLQFSHDVMLGHLTLY